MQLHAERVALRVVFVLIGAALALALLLLDITVVVLVRRDTELPSWSLAGLATVLAVAPPVALGLIPAMRTVEGVAATSLLGAEVPGATEPARTTSQRLRTLSWFVVHVLAGALVVAAVAGALDRQGWLSAPMFVGSVVLAALLGSGLARLAPRLLGPSYAERIALLERDVDRAVERNRLAREIHDGVGHALSLVAVQAGAARRVIRHDPEFAVAALEAIEDAARRAAADLDRVLGLLRDDAVPSRQPVAGLDALEELVRATRTAGLDVRHRVVGDLAPLPEVVSREGYRIVQEALTNALRYSADGPTRLEVSNEPGGLLIACDNPAAREGGPAWSSRRSRGLVGLGERVAALGGSLEAGPVDGRWRLRATIPVPDQRPQEEAV